jgi:hypothetical protein
LTDALRGSQWAAGGAKLKHTFCAALVAPQIGPGKRCSIELYRACIVGDPKLSGSG